jgi:hypothetical protein
MPTQFFVLVSCKYIENEALGILGGALYSSKQDHHHHLSARGKWVYRVASGPTRRYYQCSWSFRVRP